MAATTDFATVRPWLWFLTRTADCRIFQDMKVPDIIKMVFADHKSADFKLELTGTYGSGLTVSSIGRATSISSAA